MTANERALGFWLIVSMMETHQVREHLLETQRKLIEANFKLLARQEAELKQRMSELAMSFEGL